MSAPAGRAPARGRAPAARTAPLDRARAEALMGEALALARRGLGRTSPNPAVGALVVRDGQVVGRGYHARAGGPHAEVVALRAAGALARGADLFTTLEPCDHFGRTPPCSRAILGAGVARVWVGSGDPFPLARGRGMARLRRGGVEVVRGVLQEECDRFYAPWFTFVTAGRPYVTLKAAVTLDGRIATRTGDARWVSGLESRAWVHRARDQADAVLVGAGTARADDPRLTARLRGARDPLRVVLDTDLRLPAGLRLFVQRSRAPTVVAHASGRRRRLGPGVELLRCRRGRGGVDLPDLLGRLAARGVVHLLVEGGARVHARFLSEGLADALAVVVAPKLLGGDGLPLWPGRGPERMAKALRLRQVRIERLGDDVLVCGLVPRPRRRTRLAKASARG